MEHIKPIIRIASIDNSYAVMKLEYELFKKWNRMDKIDKIDHSWFFSITHKKSFISTINNKRKKVYIAEIKGTIIGYIKAEILERESFLKKTGYISEVYVMPKYRGNKIATMLLKEALVWFKNNKLSWTTVSTHSFDKEANSFWEKSGYKEFNKFYKMKL